MTVEKFVRLVKKLEKQAKRSPGFYRFRVLLLTLFGYGYVFFFLLFFLSLAVLMLAFMAEGRFNYAEIKVMLWAGPMVYLILRAMMIRPEKPDGIVLKPKDAPELFRVLDELGKQAKSPRLDLVVLNDDFTAGVSEQRRFGWVGKKEYILVIGFPLLLSLTPEEMKAVLAHELAHLSKADTRFSSWIYRVNNMWFRLLGMMEERKQFGLFLFRMFFRKFFPYYSAYTYVLRRNEEYRADAWAAEMTDPRTAGTMLVRLHVCDGFYEGDFIGGRIRDTEENGTPLAIFTDYHRMLPALGREEKEKYLQAALDRETDLTDSHPCLKDRLTALGVEPAVPEPANRSAAEAYFPDFGHWLQRMDRYWLERHGDRVKVFLEERKEEKERLQELKRKDDLTVREQYELAGLLTEHEGLSAARPVYEGIIRRCGYSDEASIAFMILGRMLLEEDETAEQGARYIRKASELRWSMRLDGLQLLQEYYESKGDRGKAEEAAESLRKWMEYLKETDEEIEAMDDVNGCVPHDLPEEELEELREAFARQRFIEKVYLVRMKFRAAMQPERRHYVFGLVHSYPVGAPEREIQAFERSLVNWLLGHPRLMMTVFLINRKQKLERQFADITGSLVFDRKFFSESKPVA